VTNTIIHIGMPRTATTFFQQNVFPFIPDYLAFNLETTHFDAVFNQLQFADDTFYDNTKILDFANNCKNKNIILSNENFVGQSYFLNHNNRTSIAKRLSEAFPEAKILLVLRNQIDLLASLYAISLEWRETKHIDDYIWQPIKDKNTDVESGPAKLYYNTYEDYENIEGYDYLSLIQLYKKYFNHVEVLLFEDFIHQPKDFATKLDALFGFEQPTTISLLNQKELLNKSVDVVQARKLRKLNKFQNLASHSKLLYRIYVKLKRNILKKKRSNEKPCFSLKKTAELKTHFGKLNKQLAEQYPEIGLQKHHEKYYF